MKGIRFELLSGRVVEVTHHAGCIQPAEAWIVAHHKAHERTVKETPDLVAIERIVVFESPRPIHRGYDVFGVIDRDDSAQHGTREL